MPSLVVLHILARAMEIFLLVKWNVQAKKGTCLTVTIEMKTKAIAVIATMQELAVRSFL
jgi:hypothetical protein